MKRREKWTILILLLLPSMIGIAALSWIRSTENTPTPGHAVPAAIPGPQDSGEAIEGAPMQSAPSASGVPGATAPAPAIDATEPETEDAEERRPLIPVVMLADNHAAPTVEVGSYAAADSPSRESWGVARSHSGIGGSAFGGGFSSGSQREPTVTQTDSNSSQDNKEIGEDGGRSDVDPFRDTNDEPLPGELPSDDTYEPGANPPANDGGGYPFDPFPQDLLRPIDHGPGGGFGGEPKQHVSVPEPSTWSLFGIALLGTALHRRKKKS